MFPCLYHVVCSRTFSHVQFVGFTWNLLNASLRILSFISFSVWTIECNAEKECINLNNIRLVECEKCVIYARQKTNSLKYSSWYFVNTNKQHIRLNKYQGRSKFRSVKSNAIFSNLFSIKIKWKI